MTKATDAKVGDKEVCQICITEMTCGLTKGTPEHPPKNQWQVDGKAHYNYDFKTKTTTCNSVVIEDPKNVRTPEVVNPIGKGILDKVYEPMKTTSPEIV